MEINIIPIDKLLSDNNNVRSHNKKNIEAIKGSIAKFGQVEPLIVNKRTGIIIGGNGRLEAMKQLEFKEVKIHYVDLDNTQALALSLALNRTAELADWNNEKLPDLLKTLDDDEFDLESIGFDEDDLIKMLPLDDLFNNNLNENDSNDNDKNKKYILELEFADEQAQKDCYEDLCAQGLIVRFK